MTRRVIAALAVSCVGLLLFCEGFALAAQLTLNWVGADPEAWYVIERALDGGAFAEIGRTPIGVTNYVDQAVMAELPYCYRVRAQNFSGISDYSNVACATASAPAGLFIDGFDRPDSALLGNNWSTVSGALTIQAGQLRSAPVRAMHAAVQEALVGATQVVSARFASANNNLGPRFGLYLRYQNAKNYYACYRIAGGSSVLRIAKVVNGVETVLRAIHVSNPPWHRFFTLDCQAAGPTLTLGLNGAVKLAATDSTFASGRVGMFMGYAASSSAMALSHRADDFTAGVE